jgi:myosin heavy subunit
VFAAPDSVKATLHIAGLDCGDFRYTGHGDIDTYMIEGVSDGDRFEQTMQVLELLDVTEAQRNDLQRIIAGIVFLGQVRFDI